MILRSYAGHKIVINCNIINNAHDCVANISCIYTGVGALAAETKRAFIVELNFAVSTSVTICSPLIRKTISRCEIDHRQSGLWMINVEAAR